MKFSGIGGQAVIEGIMMRSKTHQAIAVRKQDGTISTKTEKVNSFKEKHKWAGWPVIRGFVSLCESLKAGMGTLMWSANQQEDENGKSLEMSKGEMSGTILLAVVLAIGIFVALPMLLTGLLEKIPFFAERVWLVKIIEGILRLVIFIVYVSLTSLLKDIKRTYMYHGAEHKCINCVEHGLPLTVDNVMKSSKEHRRCGTSFLLIVMLISIIVFILIPLPKFVIPTSALLSKVSTKLVGLLIRIAMIPIVAGISYELQQFTGRHDNLFTKIISRPGMWMQGLTTKEPTADMCEVAIAATEQVFDWKAFLTENFGWVAPPEPEVIQEETEEETQEETQDSCDTLDGEEPVATSDVVE